MKKLLTIQIVNNTAEVLKHSGAVVPVETDMPRQPKCRRVRSNRTGKNSVVQEISVGDQDAFDAVVEAHAQQALAGAPILAIEQVTLCVGVPVEFAKADEAEPDKGRNEYKEHLATGQTAHRILIVEDQERDWQLMHRRLCQAGFQVRVALNGAEGVEAFKKWRPRFIWMDSRMPVMDGMEATRRIRALEGGRDIKIVILSASTRREEREAARAAGADDFAAKPIGLESVYDLMNKHLGAQFVVDAPSSVWETEPPVALDHEALAALPLSLRTELVDALVSLDCMTPNMVERSHTDSETVPLAMEPAVGMDQDALKALPPSLRTELAEALASGDHERIAVSIRRVAGLNPSLSDFLEHQGGRFGYAFVLHALQGSPRTGLKVEAA